MSQASAEISDFSGMKFFSRSPFHSGLFLTEAAFLIAVILSSAAFFVVYWNRLSLLIRALLFVFVCVRAIYSMWGALLKHKRVRDVYFTRSSDIPAESPVHVALDVAARAILEDLFYTHNTLLAFLFMAVLLLHRAT